jgi:thaumarchaeosortase
METVMNWEELRIERLRLRSIRTIFFALSFSLPTIYVAGANFGGWNEVFQQLAETSGVAFSNLMPLSIEYLVFAVLFVLITFVGYGMTNLRNYSISTVFLGAIGAIYTINNVYPYGHFTPFQILVPTTTILAAGVLNVMGYTTSIVYSQNLQEGSLPVLTAFDSRGTGVGFKIAWPCSGVESLIIYSVTMLLFLSHSAIPWKQRIVYFIFGAGMTYVINVLRIVTFYTIAMGGGSVMTFHDFYGQLYSISWIISYPLLIITSRALWGKIIAWRAGLSRGLRVSPPERLPR